jgi:hypothetical protein
MPLQLPILAEGVESRHKMKMKSCGRGKVSFTCLPPPPHTPPSSPNYESAVFHFLTQLHRPEVACLASLSILSFLHGPCRLPWQELLSCESLAIKAPTAAVINYLMYKIDLHLWSSLQSHIASRVINFVDPYHLPVSRHRGWVNSEG